ncbi:MAG: serine/threonine-protein kinase [Polyangiales bacterium]
MTRAEEDPIVLAERYRVLKPIGRGGMGAVFEAVHVHTGRRLAVKTLLAQYVNDAVLVERFMREARATTAIGDPHVVEIVDIGRTPEGDVFMVMELLEGRELKRAIRDDAPLPIERACHIARQIGEVMGRAHALGIVHRDLKPANVFLVQRDRDPDYVKVLDFGIAKLDASAHPDVAAGQTMTRTGQIIGTPSYMSPEQLQGLKELDARSDVYALGVILYQAIAGSLPIRGESIPDIFLKVMTTEAPALATFRDDVPAELDGIVRRALSREPAARFADGAAFAEALAPYAARWVVGSAPTVAGISLRPRPDGAGGNSQNSAPTPLSSPQVLHPAPDPSILPAAPSPPSSPRALQIALAAAALAAIAVVAWRPWSHAPPVAASRDAAAAPVARVAPEPPLAPAPEPPPVARALVDAGAPIVDVTLARTPTPAKAPRVRPRRTDTAPPIVGEIMQQQ